MAKILNADIDHVTILIDGPPSDYLVSVDLVEFFSGLDFFSALPDSAEDLLEQEPAAGWPIGRGK